MNKKVILILVDGMTTDSLKESKHPFIDKFIANSISNLYSTTVMPSVTLPCHMSLFHSVTPQRHGILSNTYVPQVRPIVGLFDQLRKHGKSAASFYNWEQLRDLSRPDSLAHSCYISLHQYDNTDFMLANNAIEYINDKSPDFVFLYLGTTDETGHQFGWMTKEYIEAVYNAWSCIEKLYKSIPNEYKVIVTADHGGHDFSHGTELPSDMTIPIIINGISANMASPKMESANIIDITPTIAKLIGIEADNDWKGQSLIC